MHKTSLKFGTGGWRAIIGEEFTRFNVEKIMQAISQLFPNEKVLVAYDRRFLSKHAAYWAANVFVGNGNPVLLVDEPIPTPVHMYGIKELNLEIGIMITASHNPAEYNGIKVIVSEGRDAPIELTKAIEEVANSIDVIKRIEFDEHNQGEYVEIIDIMNDYLDYVLSTLNHESIKSRKLNVLLNPMFGVSKHVLSSILYTTRCHVDVMNERHDTLFGGQLPSPNLETLEKLRLNVLHKGYDLGIATDGDADRIGVIDDTGRYINPTILMALIYRYLHEAKAMKGPIVRSISTSHLLDHVARDYGEEIIEVPVGFKHISRAITDNHAVIGGETSGGITVRGHIHGKDAVYSAALLIELLGHYKKPLSHLVDELNEKFGEFHIVERDYSMSEEEMQTAVSRLKVSTLPDVGISVKEIKQLESYKVIYEDESWICIRPSGTEPVLRIISESRNIEWSNKLNDIFERYLGLGK